MDIISRADAKRLGKTHYFTGVECKHGHLEPRFTSCNTCVTCHRTNVGKWQSENREKYNASARKGRRKYLGYPIPDYDPPGNCEICPSTDSGKNDWNLDHNHVTNKFRGWLCSRCNGALGMFKDDPELLIKAAEYLLKRN